MSVTDYWPTALGIVVMAGAWTVLKPDEPKGISNRGIAGQIRAEDQATDLPSEDDELEASARPQKKRVAIDRGDPEAAAQGPQQDPEYIMVEKVIAVPLEPEAPEIKSFKTDDPAVRSALRQVEVVLWRTADCEHCRSAERFLRQNQVSFREKDIADPNLKERLRRLSGGTSVPVIEVDGRLVRGFSAGSLQAALTDAVKARVAR